MSALFIRNQPLIFIRLHAQQQIQSWAKELPPYLQLTHQLPKGGKQAYFSSAPYLKAYQRKNKQERIRK